MRVLFTAYERFGLEDGGLQIQMRKTAAALAQRGVIVEWLDPWSNQLPTVDLLHVFTIDGGSSGHVAKAKESGIKIVMSPVFNAFSSRLAPIKGFASRHIPGWYTDLKRAARLLHAADHIVFLNEEERHLVHRVLGHMRTQSSIVPNGCDLRNADPATFNSQFDLAGRRWVLNVARFSPIKNQLTLVRAMRKVDAPLVLIGDASHGQQAYLAECRKAAGPQALFVGPLRHDDRLLASAYAAAHVFALPSRSEVMPLALTEAAAARCHLVTSRTVPLPAGISSISVPARSVRQLRTAVAASLELPGRARQMLAPRSWDDVAASLDHIYRQLLSDL